ncbi:fibrinogen-like YCDxxxxGGGW domain-containing protein [Chryseobacterium cucumeris]|uniref:fibrinogen-like YCDxxxxGGGW domain-containing protein n=1 Tax=Chryseobacterium cucumeris TaxID=1813611 RepID=UPI0023F1E141|nr:fibrinogen-like YCDxxxxGGGW domain-containing protein [Chryseobacterium cucumeris]
MSKNFKNRLLTFFAVITASIACAQVGINTTNPQGVFNIDGNKNNPNTGIPTINQQADDFVVLSDGKTGVGTTVPTHQLHIKAMSNPLRAEGLVNGLKTDSIVMVDGATGVFRLKSVSSIGEIIMPTACNPTITGGSIANNQPYGCSGYTPGAFISDPADPGIGGTPIYTWQQSTDGGKTWTTAEGISNGQNYDPPALTMATKYRRAAVNACGSIYSNEVAIAIDGVTSGIMVSPCVATEGNNISLSIGLDTGTTVVNWTASDPNLSFTSTTTANTNLIVPTGMLEGTYTVTVTVSSSCGIKSFTTSVKVIPSGVNIGSLKKSCKEILSSGLSTGDGIYWIDPDGSGNAYCAEKVYCNMTSNDGGWTLILKSMVDNDDFQYSSARWLSGIPFNDSDFDITDGSTSNALYAPYNYLQSREFWVDFVTTPDLTPFIVPIAGTPKTLANSGFNVNVANQYLNQSCTDSTGVPSVYYTPGNAYNWYGGGLANGVNLGAPGGIYAAVRFGVITNNETNEVFNTANSGLGIGAKSATDSPNIGSGNANNNIYYDPGCASSNIGTSGIGFFKAVLWAR